MFARFSKPFIGAFRPACGNPSHSIGACDYRVALSSHGERALNTSRGARTCTVFMPRARAPSRLARSRCRRGTGCAPAARRSRARPARKPQAPACACPSRMTRTCDRAGPAPGRGDGGNNRSGSRVGVRKQVLRDTACKPFEQRDHLGVLGPEDALPAVDELRVIEAQAELTAQLAEIFAQLDLAALVALVSLPVREAALHPLHGHAGELRPALEDPVEVDLDDDAAEVVQERSDLAFGARRPPGRRSRRLPARAKGDRVAPLARGRDAVAARLALEHVGRARREGRERMRSPLRGGNGRKRRRAAPPSESPETISNCGTSRCHPSWVPGRYSATNA